MRSFSEWLKIQEGAAPAPAPVKTPTPTKEPEKEPHGPWSPEKPKVVPGPKQAIDWRPDEEGEYLSAAPAVKPAPKTTPAPVAPPAPERKSPWSPPKPKVIPGPKQTLGMPLELSFAQYLQRREAYEDEAHGDTQRFWREFPNALDPSKKHIFHANPIMRLYGQQLSKSSFDTISDLATRHGSPMDPSQMMRLISQIMSIEEDHVERLEEIAKKVVEEIMGIPPEILDAEITSQTEIEKGEGEEEEGDREAFEDLPEALKKKIQKRITINAMTHGGSIHSMYSAHYLAKRYLERLGQTEDWVKQLLQLYNMIVPTIHKPYWLFSVAQVAAASQATGSQGGSSRVDYSQEDKPVVKAKGVIFPILIHELIKGSMELLSHHGMEDETEEETRKIIQYGDRAIDEMWLLQVGRDLWAKFLGAINKMQDKPSNAEILQALYKKSPDEVHNILMAILDNSDRAGAMLQDLVKKKDEVPAHSPEPEEPDKSEDPADWWKKT